MTRAAENTPAQSPAVPPAWRRFLHRWAIDRAVFYSIAHRFWQFGSGIITLLLITRYFSRELQGYFYTYWSLVALQAFLELGFSTVIMNAASHEWAHLGLNEQGYIVGDSVSRSRLISLARLSIRWYSYAALLFVVVIGPAGAAFLAANSNPNISWSTTWCAVVVLSGLSICTIPFHAILEGCNQVATVNRFRLWQGIAGSITVWLCLVAGAGLGTAVAIVVVKLLFELLLVGWRYRHFVATFLEPPGVAQIPWREEIWPLQWRIALQGVFNYFSSSLMTPVLFHFHGSVVAGQMGMTWNVISSIQSIAMSWVQTRAPAFGVMVAKRNFAQLENSFRKLVLISVGIAICGVLIFLIVVLGLNYGASFSPRVQNLADRFVDPGALAIFALAIVLQHVPSCQSYYIRAHKREMLLASSVVIHLSNGILILLLGKYFGARGAATALIITTAFIMLPWQTYLWHRCRVEREVGQRD